MDAVLIVDDEKEITISIARVLKSKWKIYSCNHQNQIWPVLETAEISVILIDFDLKSDKTGIQISEKIKALYPHIQIILFTGNTDYNILKNALNSGSIDSFLNKPINTAELRQIVAENIEQWKKQHDKIEEIIEKIKTGGLTRDDIAYFGTNINILNSIIQKSVHVHDENPCQIIGLRVSEGDVLVYDNILSEKVIIKDQLLFFGFIETIQKFGRSLLPNSYNGLQEINISPLTLLISKRDNQIISAFLVNYMGDDFVLQNIQNLFNVISESNENIFDELPSLVENINLKFMEL